ncbi:DEAD/DEAH box helicase family protein [bacterium]|nr:DEAD/DEAH box helicase family protein [bacterium]
MSDVKTYLGQKGYSIYKDKLSVKEQQWIRDELMVAPFIPKSLGYGVNQKFPIYRESKNKLYVPRYFGEETYGEPDETRLDEPQKVDMKFTGSLRDYQTDIVGKYMESTKNGGGLLEIPCGRGKTVMALKIAANLGLKTLVIVHKTFLADQWIERIQQFIPNARIGRIQGQTIDIDDKDIVIGMLQSLSMKEYPYTFFSDFGLTIVDEVHHIAAEVFVRSLFQIVTKYVLGLSATMQRKDGLTKVFKMFLGDIIYKEKAIENENVNVRIYDYISNDEEFNETKYDFRGNTAYSSMMTKLCNFNPRREFVVKIVKDLIEENPNQQIMILGHYKNLLTYLYKSIEHKNIASVGYYVGGMKKEALKESEEKQIIIATYSMASEALDIKSLTTLVMATPKTDVTQSIGRILRTKHSKPLVVDVTDQHDVFKRQCNKRIKYYNKQGYKIQRCSNKNYNDFTEVIGKKRKGKKKNSIILENDNPLKGKCLINLT